MLAILFGFVFCIGCTEKPIESIIPESDTINYEDPQDATAWNKRGLVLRCQGENEESLQAYNKAIELYPQDARAWYNKGYELYRINRYDEATQAFDQFLEFELDPLNYEYITYAVTFIRAMNGDDAALQAYDKAIEIDPLFSEAWTNKGITLDTQEKYNEALKAFDKSIDIDPQYTNAWFYKSITLNKLGRVNESFECFREASRLGFCADEQSFMI